MLGTRDSTASRITRLSLVIRSRAIRASVFTWSSLVGVLITSKWDPAIIPLVLAPLSTFLIALGVYILNDLFDSSVDEINRPELKAILRPQRRDTFGLVVGLMSAGILIGYALGHLTLLISIAEVSVGALYSIRPFSLKDRFIVKTVSIGGGGVLANFFGGAAGGIIDPSLVFCSVMFLTFIFVTSPLNDLADYPGDLEGRRKTIPIVIGPENTIRLAMILSVVPFIAAVVFFQYVQLNMFSIIILFAVSVRALQLIWPMRNSNGDLTVVKKNHRKMIVLHFILQGAIGLGVLAL